MIAMSKTNPLVILDPGHGPLTNPYPAASGFYEGTQMYKLMLVLKKRLEDNGIKVITTRKQLSDDPDLTTRGRTAGNNNADLFISLHSDAIGNYVASAKGVSAYYSIQDPSTNKALAAQISSEVSALMGTRDRGALTRIGNGNLDYYGVIRSSAASGCKNAFLIEHGFHTNSDDVKWLISDSKLAQIAEVETKVLCKYFNKAYTPGSTNVKINVNAKIMNAPDNTVSMGTQDGKTVTIYKQLHKYTNAANALAANTSLASGYLQPGAYYIYKEYNGATNLTKTPGTPGSWVVISNAESDISAEVDKPTAEPDKHTTSVAYKLYMNSADAASKINALKNSDGSYKTYPAGTYYVYKRYSGTIINISTKANTAGAWVNINDFVETKVKSFHKGDIVEFIAGMTPYYTDGTRVPLYVIAEVNGRRSSPVISVDSSGAATIYNVEKTIPAKYIDIAIPATDETIAKANQYSDTHTTKKDLESLLENTYGSLVLLANSKGYKEFISYMDSLLEDDVVIDTDADLDPIMGKAYLTAKHLTNFIKTKNPAFDSTIAYEFIERCKKYNIRGDVALCQSILETGWFKYEGSAVTPDQHNYAGIGVTSNGVKGLKFSNVGVGVEAQLQHLYAYATKDPLPMYTELVDPRFNLVNRGSAPRWVDLNQKWSSGVDYGQKILAIYKAACNSAL
jgi:N-acetylmuramoyl-L-alanine amidase